MPIDKDPYLNRETTWIKPVLVAEVKFDEWTPDGILRAPVFLRLRDDKKPNKCLIEADKPIKDLSHVGHDPKSKPQKGELADRLKLTREAGDSTQDDADWKQTQEQRA